MVKHRTIAIVAGSEPPVVSISWEPPLSPIDSGYCILLSDVEPDSDDEDDSELVCLHCVIDDYPEIGRALELAREHGQVDLDDGVWVAADPNHRRYPAVRMS